MLAIAAGLSALSAPAFAQRTVRDGIEAWQRADYAAAVAIWRPLAEKGDSDAAFNLGQAYRLGRGVSVDLAVAQKWLIQAANAGHLDAQTTLGLLLFDSGSRDVALQWLKRAAERGEPRAMLVYGTALFNGDGVPRDQVLAYAYVSRSAAQGLEPARSTLAELDNILPVEIRKQGVALALSKVKAKPAPRRAARPSPKLPEKPAVVAAAKPSPKPAQKAQPAPTPSVAGGKWRIQLGAFSRRTAAEALYRKLSASAPVAGHPPFYAQAGTMTRLQVGGFASRSAASAACATLSARGQACFPVEGK
ncbi:MAG TPA: SPOR domain-containing protein [Sphingomicrobium sp.]|nr:SPOR domain-containing protein [Sphingomicrobium sp.]